METSSVVIGKAKLLNDLHNIIKVVNEISIKLLTPGISKNRLKALWPGPSFTAQCATLQSNSEEKGANQLGSRPSRLSINVSPSLST